MKAQPYIVMAKPVGSLCNMECSFCYYLNTPSEQNLALSEEKGPVQSKMSGELLENFIKQYIASSPGPVVSFTWHGGEPTLAGLDFYKLAVELQKKYLPEGWICWNNLQTNGLLLDEKWCAFLASEKFQVGLSIDGTAHIHDKHRKDRGNKKGSAYEGAVAAVRLLQSHGLQPDLLCTVNSDTAKRPLDVYRALRKLNTGWIQFIPVVVKEKSSDPEGGPGGLKMTAESVSGPMYGDFLCAVFDEWLLNDLGRLDVQLFAETMQVWAGGRAGLCWMTPTCGRALIVESEGSVYSCDHFVAPDHRIGDINTSDLGELADSQAQIRFGLDKRDSLPGQCRSCPWLKFCNGGCPKDRFALSKDGEPGLNYLCQGFSRFFSYIEPALSLVDSFAQQGLSSEAIMTKLRERFAALWKGVGRNDPCPCGSGKKAKSCCWAKRI